MRQGRRLGPDELVVCADDEKLGIQARRHRVEPPRPAQLARVESDYRRCGTLQFLCAWDVQRGLRWGRCEPKTGIAPFFDRLVGQVMTQDHYRSSRRVSRIVDHGSSPHGKRATVRLQQKYANLVQLEHHILNFEARSRARARPYAWLFTLAQFERRLRELAAGSLLNFCRRLLRCEVESLHTKEKPC